MRRQRNPAGPAAALLLLPLLLAALRPRKKQATVTEPYPYPKPAKRGAPFAKGIGVPLWPVDLSSTNDRLLDVSYKDVQGKWHGNSSRAFRAKRQSKGNPPRNHVGVDLYANADDIVRAPEGGEFFKTQPFKAGTYAVILKADSGINILLGEVTKNSWNEFGWKKGDRVRRGDPIARVGRMDSKPDEPGIQGGAHMLHLEIYACCPTSNIRWYQGEKPNPLIRDPTDWLLRAKAGASSSVSVA